METLSQMKENLAAAMDRQALSHSEQAAVQRYAEATRAYSCDGCGHLCGGAVDAEVDIATTMRCMMYHDSYGDTAKARRVFRRLPAKARRLAEVDFSRANAACPNGIDVAGHMRRAAKVLT
jgi:predicted aldo/keto reductase-like oxidoreductase